MPAFQLVLCTAAPANFPHFVQQLKPSPTTHTNTGTKNLKALFLLHGWEKRRRYFVICVGYFGDGDSPGWLSLLQLILILFPGRIQFLFFSSVLSTPKYTLPDGLYFAFLLLEQIKSIRISSVLVGLCC